MGKCHVNILWSSPLGSSGSPSPVTALQRVSVIRQYTHARTSALDAAVEHRGLRADQDGRANHKPNQRLRLR